MATAGLQNDQTKWLYHRAAREERRRRRHRRLAGQVRRAVISPPLDDAGNSIPRAAGDYRISNALGGNPYAPKK